MQVLQLEIKIYQNVVYLLKGFKKMYNKIYYIINSIISLIITSMISLYLNLVLNHSQFLKVFLFVIFLQIIDVIKGLTRVRKEKKYNKDKFIDGIKNKADHLTLIVILYLFSLWINSLYNYNISYLVTAYCVWIALIELLSIVENIKKTYKKENKALSFLEETLQTLNNTAERIAKLKLNEKVKK